MAPKTARHTILSAIASFDAETDDLRIVIETPKGSRNKHSYDPECDCLQLSTVLPEGIVFPLRFWLHPFDARRRRRSTRVRQTATLRCSITRSRKKLKLIAIMRCGKTWPKKIEINTGN